LLNHETFKVFETLKVFYYFCSGQQDIEHCEKSDFSKKSDFFDSRRAGKSDFSKKSNFFNVQHHLAHYKK